MAVKLGKMRTNTPQINEPINRTQQVVLRNVIFQRKLIKPYCLRLLPWSQNRKSPCPIHRLTQRLTIRSSKSFSTQSAPSSHSLRDHLTTAVGEFADFLTCDSNGCLGFRQCKNLSFFRVNSIFCFTKPINSQIAKLVGSVAIEILFILTLCSRDSA